MIIIEVGERKVKFPFSRATYDCYQVSDNTKVLPNNIPDLRKDLLAFIDALVAHLGAGARDLYIDDLIKDIDDSSSVVGSQYKVLEQYKGRDNGVVSAVIFYLKDTDRHGKELVAPLLELANCLQPPAPAPQQRSTSFAVGR